MISNYTVLVYVDCVNLCLGRQCWCKSTTDRCIIIRPWSVVVSLRWMALGDIANSTNRKSVGRQIDTRLLPTRTGRPDQTTQLGPRPAELLYRSLSTGGCPSCDCRSWTIKRFMIAVDMESNQNRCPTNTAIYRQPRQLPLAASHLIAVSGFHQPLMWQFGELSLMSGLLHFGQCTLWFAWRTWNKSSLKITIILHTAFFLVMNRLQKEIYRRKKFW